MGVCLMSLCYASCDLTSDAGTAADGGMVAPCKNKSFACMDAPGHPTMVCAPNPNADSGKGDDAAGGDASVE
jgi:hypothetical protein